VNYDRDKCPHCDDTAIKRVPFGEMQEPAWVLDGWPSEDYEHSQEILFCPFCGGSLENQK
jgi:hypothetical protein